MFEVKRLQFQGIIFLQTLPLSGMLAAWLASSALVPSFMIGNVCLGVTAALLIYKFSFGLAY